MANSSEEFSYAVLNIRDISFLTALRLQDFWDTHLFVPKHSTGIPFTHNEFVSKFQLSLRNDINDIDEEEQDELYQLFLNELFEYLRMCGCVYIRDLFQQLLELPEDITRTTHWVQTTISISDDSELINKILRLTDNLSGVVVFKCSQLEKAINMGNSLENFILESFYYSNSRCSSPASIVYKTSEDGLRIAILNYNN